MLYNDYGQGHDKVNNGYHSFAYKAGFPAFITFYYPLMPLDKLFSITHQGAFIFRCITRKAALT
jgi:hypothetical protein